MPQDNPNPNKEVVVQAAPKPPLIGGGRIAAIVPNDFEACYRLATVIVKSGLAPKGVDTIEKATVIIMHGLELGLPPMASLQSIASINGFPSVYGDGMLALVQNSGLLEDFDETIEEDEHGPTVAVCKVKRVGRPAWVVSSFTRPEAQRAGLWKKSGPWTQYPQRMMKFRARSWALRDAFPDVLRGLHSAEEAADMVDITPRGSATTTAPEPRRSDYVHKAGTQSKVDPDWDPPTGGDEEKHDPETGEIHDQVLETTDVKPIDPADWMVDGSLMRLEDKIKDFEAKAANAKTADEIDAVEKVNADFRSKLGEAYLKRVNLALAKRRKEIGK